MCSVIVINYYKFELLASPGLLILMNDDLPEYSLGVDVVKLGAELVLALDVKMLGA